MTPDGEILGATPAQPALADDSEYLPLPAVAASPAPASLGAQPEKAR